MKSGQRSTIGDLSVEEDAVSRAAAEWLLELQSRDVTPERIAEWQRWLSASSRHSDEFGRMENLMRTAGGVRGVSRPSALELAADRYNPGMSVSAWRRGSGIRHRFWWR